MSLTSLLYRAARLSADARAGSQAVKQGSLWPIFRRLANKGIGRLLVSRLFIRR